mmetsp:Transcript_9143/g.17413  ORF Transcript_9143/g.17413 Transcript_9143/m.17413 type:complete len:1500 (-) Transcript_9143:156-4655(-)
MQNLVGDDKWFAEKARDAVEDLEDLLRAQVIASPWANKTENHILPTILDQLLVCTKEALTCWEEKRIPSWGLESLENRLRALLMMVEDGSNKEKLWHKGVLIEKPEGDTAQRMNYTVRLGRLQMKNKFLLTFAEYPLDPGYLQLYPSPKRPGVLLLDIKNAPRNKKKNIKSGLLRKASRVRKGSSFKEQKDDEEDTAHLEGTVVGSLYMNCQFDYYRVMHKLLAEQRRLKMEDFLRTLPPSKRMAIQHRLRLESGENWWMQFLHLPADPHDVKKGQPEDNGEGYLDVDGGLDFTIRFRLKHKRTLELTFREKRRMVIYDAVKDYVEPVIAKLTPADFMGFVCKDARCEIDLRQKNPKVMMHEKLPRMLIHTISFKSMQCYIRAKSFLSWFSYHSPPLPHFVHLCNQVALCATGLLPAVESAELVAEPGKTLAQAVPCIHQVISAMKGCMSKGRLVHVYNVQIDNLLKESLKSLADAPTQTEKGNCVRLQILVKKLLAISEECKSHPLSCSCEDRSCSALVLTLLGYLRPLIVPCLTPQLGVSPDVSFWTLKFLYLLCKMIPEAHSVCPAPYELPNFTHGVAVDLPFEFYVGEITNNVYAGAKDEFIRGILDVLWELMVGSINTEAASSENKKMYEDLSDGSLFPIILAFLYACPVSVEIYGLEKIITLVKKSKNVVAITKLKDWQLGIFYLLTKALPDAQGNAEQNRAFGKGMDNAKDGKDDGTNSLDIKSVGFQVTILTDLHFGDMLEMEHKVPSKIAVWTTITLLRLFFPWKPEARSGGRMMLVSLAVAMVSYKSRVKRANGVKNAHVRRNFFYFLLLVGEYVFHMRCVSGNGSASSPTSPGSDKDAGWTDNLLYGITNEANEKGFDTNDIGLLDSAVKAAKDLQLHKDEDGEVSKGPERKIPEIVSIFEALRAEMKKFPEGSTNNEASISMMNILAKWERLSMRFLLAKHPSQAGDPSPISPMVPNASSALIWIGLPDGSDEIPLRAADMAIDFVRSRRNTAVRTGKVFNSRRTNNKSRHHFKHIRLGGAAKHKSKGRVNSTTRSFLPVRTRAMSPGSPTHDSKTRQNHLGVASISSNKSSPVSSPRTSMGSNRRQPSRFVDDRQVKRLIAESQKKDEEVREAEKRVEQVKAAAKQEIEGIKYALKARDAEIEQLLLQTSQQRQTDIQLKRLKERMQEQEKNHKKQVNTLTKKTAMLQRCIDSLQRKSRAQSSAKPKLSSPSRSPELRKKPQNAQAAASSPSDFGPARLSNGPLEEDDEKEEKRIARRLPKSQTTQFQQGEAKASSPEGVEEKPRLRGRSRVQDATEADPGLLQRAEEAIPTISASPLRDYTPPAQDVKRVVETLNKTRVFTNAIQIRANMIHSLLQCGESADDVIYNILSIKASGVECTSWQQFINVLMGQKCKAFKAHILGMLDAVTNAKMPGRALKDVMAVAEKIGPIALRGLLSSVLDDQDSVPYNLSAVFYLFLWVSLTTSISWKSDRGLIGGTGSEAYLR